METQIFAVIIFILGLLLYFFIRKRKFNRRNVAGIETFSSYEKSVFIRLLELIGRILSFILIGLGILLFWASYTQEKKREKTRQAFIFPIMDQNSLFEPTRI
ncbi:molybdenum ABC transporter permease [Pedobacter sp. KLB.chiD]|uniref:molybdenum ABC transporter permease n=1 Tax=Pedobacter sp. KLB.chiD TaxID=3387402 RepID=UPI00399BB3E0